jgi:hypothetical protein
VEDSLFVFSEGFGFVIYFEQMFGYGCSGSREGVVVFRKLIDDLLDTRYHGDPDFARDCKVQVHAEVVMNLASTDFHFTRTIIEESFIGSSLEPSSHSGDDSCQNVAYFEVIDIPNDCQLLPFDNLIGDAGVVRIDVKAN